MMRFVTPIVLVGISIVIFFVFTNPIFSDMAQLRLDTASYNEALDNAKTLENERDKLTAKHNSINPDSLARLQKLLPRNVDNIRLILEIEQIALPYGMVLQDVKYNTTAESGDTDAKSTAGVVQGAGSDQLSNRDYGIWDLEFSTTGTYNNFLNFTRDLEDNLRVVDISSIQFSSDTNNKLDPNFLDHYQYNFKIRTYWLKN